MIGEWVRKQTSDCLGGAARFLVRAGVSANVVTALGFILSAVVAYLIAVDRHVLGGALLIVAGLLDGLDGSLARAGAGSTPFGAFLDSTVDRLSESVTFLGVLVFCMRADDWTGIVLVYVATVGSLMVSYTRARAEGLGLTCRSGLLTRFERVLVLIVGLLSGRLVLALWVLAALSVFTASQRVYLVWTALRGSAGPGNRKIGLDG